MIHPDERALWLMVCDGEAPRTAGQALGMHPKRVRYLSAKWTRRRALEPPPSPRWRPPELDLGFPAELWRWNLHRDPDGMLHWTKQRVDPREFVK
jgi:hypothetical protein